jgi:hypothetical protein
MEVPAAGWGAAAAGAGPSASAAAAPVVAVGMWDQNVLISPETSICCVHLPLYDKETCDFNGTKPARVRLAVIEPTTAAPLTSTSFASHRTRSNF